MKKFKGWDYCYYCDELMSKEDMESWEPRMCCNGYECSCMGLPTEPPICVKCKDKYEQGKQ